jgi:hypothetical protein
VFIYLFLLVFVSFLLFLSVSARNLSAHTVQVYAHFYLSLPVFICSQSSVYVCIILFLFLFVCFCLK